jgi:hypothetical protein
LCGQRFPLRGHLKHTDVKPQRNPQFAVKSTSIILRLFLCACVSALALAAGALRAHTAQTRDARALPLHHFFAASKQSTPAPGWIDMRTAIGDDYFNGTSPLSRVARHFAIAHRLGVRYLRCAFSWDAIEPAPGRYHWRFWDALVALAARNHIELLPYVAYTPKWAARSANDYWQQPPRDPRLYAEFMYTIARRYRGRIRSWEIWNEPDNRDYWTGTAGEFAPLAVAAAKRLREADPAAVLILGGMAYGPGPFFRALIERYHIDDYVDVIAMHAYPETWDNQRAETVFQRWIPAMQALIARDNSGDALWLNEMGYADYRFSPNQASMYGVSAFYDYEHTRSYQAAMLFKFETMALASQDVALTGWYRIDDFPSSDTRSGPDQVNNHLGLMDANGRPKPDFAALAFFNRLLRGPVRVIDPHVDAPPHSQAVVEAFEKPLAEGVFRSGAVCCALSSDEHVNRRAKLIVVAWLRSSQEKEVAKRTGTLHDARSETISVALPCSAVRDLATFSAEGFPFFSSAKISGGLLSNVSLHGGQMFIATATCSFAN